MLFHYFFSYFILFYNTEYFFLHILIQQYKTKSSHANHSWFTGMIHKTDPRVYGWPDAFLGNRFGVSVTICQKIMLFFLNPRFNGIKWRYMVKYELIMTSWQFSSVTFWNDVINKCRHFWWRHGNSFKSVSLILRSHTLWMWFIRRVTDNKRIK